MSKASTFAHSAFPGEITAARSVSRRPWPAAVAGLLWLAAGVGGGYWVLQAWGRSPVTPVPAAMSSAPVVDATVLARALGAALVAEAAPLAVSRYLLQGVVAVGTSRGAALIAVDDQPARPFGLGAEVATGLVLQAVSARRVRLGPEVQGPASLTLDMQPMRETQPTLDEPRILDMSPTRDMPAWLDEPLTSDMPPTPGS